MSNKEILEKAIQKAIDGGWKEPHGNTLRVDDDGKLFCFMNGATDGVRVYGYQFNVERLIFNHEFAKALWGNNHVSKSGSDYGLIKIWAEQVAFEFEGRVYAAKPGERVRAFVKYSDDALSDHAPTELMSASKVVQQLKNLIATIPFNTHKIKAVEAIGTIPLWQYHLQQMVVSPDPIKYLGENI